jgi:hypothetical protein
MKFSRLAVVSSLSALLAASVFACGSNSGDDAGDDASDDSGTTDGMAPESGLDAFGKFDGIFDPPADATVDSSREDSSEPLDSNSADVYEAGADGSTDAEPDAGDAGLPDAPSDADSEDGSDGEADASDASSTVGDGGQGAAADAMPDAALDAESDAAPDGGDAGVAARTVTVVRVGDGTAALSSASTAVFLERRSMGDGSLAATISLPTAASGSNQPFSNTGNALSEGEITTSVDDRYVVLAGYASVPGVASISGTHSASVARVVARVDGAGVIDTSTALSNAFDANGVRGVATLDGTAFWLAGTATSTGGIEYATLGATTATQIIATPENTRRAGIFGGQLYGISASGTFDGVFSIGAGEPTTAVAATILAGFPTTAGPSPYGFAVLDLETSVPGVDTIYVADDRATASGGGVQKWTSNGTTWTLATTFTSGLATGTRGLAVTVTGTAVTIFATTTEASANSLVTLVDDGTPSPAATVLATAATNTAYRGVALSPTP